jgi:hypothetical protein
VDVRALAAAVGVSPAMINTWAHRGHFPDMPAGGRGQGRNYDIPTAVRIGVMIELMRLRTPPHAAADLSDPAARGDNKFLVVFANPNENAPFIELPRQTAEDLRRRLRELPCGSFLPNREKLTEYLNDVISDGDSPPTLTIIDIGKIEERMRRAHAEWEERDAAG